jgi:hypothetical protein
MAKRSDPQIEKPGRQNVADELDDVNATTQQQGPDGVRRELEASIEEEAQKRRKSETPPSSASK